jgi:type II secretory pathway component PulK
MKTTTIHLEDVIRAARQGVALAFALSLLALAALLVAGLSAPIAAFVAMVVLALGAASGGFGLVGRVALPHHVPIRRTAKLRRRTVEPLRVPQPR